MNHKWVDNECASCGISREKRTKKTLMAISGGKDYYQYEYRYLYFLEGGKETWERPKSCYRTTYDD